MGKGENAGYQHFLLFPQCFQKASFSESLKIRDCGKALMWHILISPIGDWDATEGIYDEDSQDLNNKLEGKMYDEDADIDESDDWDLESIQVCKIQCKICRKPTTCIVTPRISALPLYRWHSEYQLKTYRSAIYCLCDVTDYQFRSHTLHYSSNMVMSP